MIPLTDPTSEIQEDYHRHDFFTEDGEHLATVEFDDIEDDRNGIWCEVTAWTRIGHDSPEPDIAFERANLLSKGTAGTGVKSITDRLNSIGSLNWEQGFATAIFRSITAYRNASSEGTWMKPLDPDADDALEPYLLRPFIAAGGTTVLYGIHGGAKSMLAVRMSLSVATGKPFMGHKPTRVGPVLYVDFEDTVEPHQYRLAAIGQAMGLSMEDLDGLIYHERVSRSLKDARRRLRRIVRDNGIVLVVIDSVGLARAGDVSGSEQTIKLFKMFGQLNAAVLAIDHMTKENNIKVAKGNLDWREATPIGSQYTTSSARLTWSLIEMPQSSDKRKVSNLYNTKANHVAKAMPVGVTIDLDWNRRGLLTEVDFAVKPSLFEAIEQQAMSMTKPEELLVWHFSQQHEENQVLPMTVSEMAKGAGLVRSTCANYVTDRNARWWEPFTEGSHKYILSPEGMEDAHRVMKMHGLPLPGTASQVKDD